jgi:predicted permease
LELAAAADRRRVYAVQTALGATRASLIRVALLEGAILTSCATLAGASVAFWGTGALTAFLPPAIRNVVANPIDVDARAVSFMVAAAIFTWLFASLPVAWRASRPIVAQALRQDAHLTRISRAHAVARYVLMSSQVALTTLLLVAAVLFVRSFLAHLAEDKGFDSSHVATVQILPPTGTSSTRRADLERTVLARLRATASVVSVSRSESLLPSMNATTGSQLVIQGRAGTAGWVNLRHYSVDPEYAKTLGITLKAGRWLASGDADGMLVVDEAFAERYWPNGGAIGATFRMQAGWSQENLREDGWHFQVVGIAGHVRGDSAADPSNQAGFVVYGPIPETAGASGDPYAPLSFVVKLDSDRHLGSISALVRSEAAGCVVRTALVDQRYALLFGDTRVAAGLTSAFGSLAFVVAIVGVYGVVAFLVAGRTREIGIRIALGAGTGHVRRIVVGPMLAFVSLGVIGGVSSSVAVSRWFATQLFGVSPTDPLTYGVIAAAIALTSLAAAWLPVRRATRISPAITLRDG